MEMRRIEEQRKTPTPTGDGRQSQAGTQGGGGRPFSAASLKSPTSETTSEVLYSAVFEFVSLNFKSLSLFDPLPSPFLIRLPLTTDFVFSSPFFLFSHVSSFVFVVFISFFISLSLLIFAWSVNVRV